MKRPPDRKLLLAIAVLVVAASSVLARSADHAKGETQAINPIVLGGR